jgi:hypothetical protein
MKRKTRSTETSHFHLEMFEVSWVGVVMILALLSVGLKCEIKVLINYFSSTDQLVPSDIVTFIHIFNVWSKVLDNKA